MTDGPTPEQRAQLGSVGVAAGLGCSIVVTLILTIGGGVLLDQRFGTGVVWTFVGLALGLAAAGYQLWELAQIGNRKRPAGPLRRRLERMPAGRRPPAEADGATGSRSRADQE